MNDALVTKDKFLNKLAEYNTHYDFDAIGMAFDLANRLHDGQMRKSGEPYIIHPIEVSYILAGLGMDTDSIIAGLLHDVVEDTEYTREMVVDEFGEEVAIIVDGVTKLGSIKFDTKEEAQAENYRKMFLAMSKDIRVLIVKLSDRLHNMRTAQFWSEPKQKEKSRETLEIYAPLASRLGIFTLKFELEDLSLQYLHPEEYKALKKEVDEKKEDRLEQINEVISEITKSLKEMGLNFDIYGRSKHLYSVYRKMTLQHKGLDEIFDLTAIRIIVESVRDCYACLGQVHSMWKPIPKRFKDYIATPKPNMYQSIHTTLLGKNGDPFEVQIRTYEMHRIAEYGIAAHWKYKEGKSSKDSNKDEMKLSWLRQTLEWQKELDDPNEFMETLKMDLFSGQVFVFTPNGKVMDLPFGATPLDFAFKIHTDVGCKCVGAKVNGKMVTIDYPLRNGDIVEIITSSNSQGPSVDWLKIVKSSTARTKIRQYLRRENKEENIERGKELLEDALREKKYSPKELMRTSNLNRMIKDYGGGVTLNELYIQMSKSGGTINKVSGILIDYYLEEKASEKAKEKAKEKKEKEDTLEEEISKAKFKGTHYKDKKDRDNPGILVKGADNLMIRISKCCNPVPGDDVIGFITKGRGITVHRRDCSNITSLPLKEKSRLIDVEWDNEKDKGTYNVNVCIIAVDRKGIFSDISRACEDLDIHLSGVNAKENKDATVNITLTLSISNNRHMEKIKSTFKMVEGVIEVYRTKS